MGRLDEIPHDQPPPELHPQSDPQPQHYHHQQPQNQFAPADANLPPPPQQPPPYYQDPLNPSQKTQEPPRPPFQPGLYNQHQNVPQAMAQAYSSQPPHTAGQFHNGPPLSQTQGIPVAQYHQMTPSHGPEGWQTHLFGCFDNPLNALITVFCPCVTFGQIAEIIDNGQTSCATSGLLYGVVLYCIALPCLISCTYRTKLRNKYGLTESPAPDCVTHCFCECCALCQEYRELEKRGMDPSIGWQGNIAKNQRIAMMPPGNQTMMH